MCWPAPPTPRSTCGHMLAVPLLDAGPCQAGRPAAGRSPGHRAHVARHHLPVSCLHQLRCAHGAHDQAHIVGIHRLAVGGSDLPAAGGRASCMARRGALPSPPSHSSAFVAWQAGIGMHHHYKQQRTGSMGPCRRPGRALPTCVGLDSILRSAATARLRAGAASATTGPRSWSSTRGTSRVASPAWMSATSRGASAGGPAPCSSWRASSSRLQPSAVCRAAGAPSRTLHCWAHDAQQAHQAARRLRERHGMRVQCMCDTMLSGVW